MWAAIFIEIRCNSVWLKRVLLYGNYSLRTVWVMASDFKYSCTIYGHGADVRHVRPSPLPSSSLLSASRDKTARLWVEDSDGMGYHQEQCFQGHTNFTSAVAAVEPSDDFPEGLVFTGSSDKIIRAFVPSASHPIAEFKGHSDTVCALVIGQYQMIVSGSWDKTARVWVYKKTASGGIEEKQALKLEGHAASVWAVLILQQGVMATGSADKTIKLWKAGKCTYTLEGHEDCVRDLAVISACQFLSCANDATVRRWTTAGECLKVYYGHTSFIYSLSLLKDGNGFVTSAEDRTVKIWKFEENDAVQTIAIPAQSGWNITVLNNGDLAVALSDSTIRIFTKDKTRFASEANEVAYESEVTASMTQPGENGSEIDEKNVKPISALELPGAKDGQVIMVRNGTVVEAHQWSEKDMKWTKIGDVMSTSSNKTANKKTTYNGREYDFVFDVDIQEGAPALKLPYNLSEDPWFAAQKFIDNNDLSQYFLEEICTFIMDNTKEARKQYVPEASSNSTNGEDPFTGSGRYVPTDANLTSGATGQDPFTGGGRYVPGGGDNEIQLGGGAAADPMINPNRYIPGDEDAMDVSEHHAKPIPPLPSPSTTASSYFPKEGFITFDAVNLDAVLGKLKLFAGEQGALSDSETEDLKALIVPNGSSDASQVAVLWKILGWPSEYLLPALDILRLTCLRQESSCKLLCTGISESDERPKDLLEMLCTHIVAPDNTKPANANRLLSLRTLCNMFKHPDGSAFLLAGYKDIFQALSAGFSNGLDEQNESKSAPYHGNKNVQVAASSVLLNYSVLFSSAQSANLSPIIRRLSAVVRSSCVEITIVHLVTGENLSDSEATFRYLVCLGTLIYDDGNDTWVKEARALGARKVVETAGAVYSTVPKIFGCATSLSIILDE